MHPRRLVSSGHCSQDLGQLPIESLRIFPDAYVNLKRLGIDSSKNFSRCREIVWFQDLQILFYRFEDIKRSGRTVERPLSIQ